MIEARGRDSVELELPDAAATEALRPGDVVFLRGPLGAGKTTLARGAIAAWTGKREEAPSPTYTLAQTYEGPRGGLIHVDLFRLKSADEAEELGLFDAFADAARLIEWPDILGAAAPADRLEIELQFTESGRRARMTGFGRWRERMDGF
jgi:tRNA threonylcarbamoyladenosine biosynthesis protein TsaE